MHLTRGNYWRLLRCLLKEIQTFVRLLQQKDCRGTAEVNDTFKLLPGQKDCWRLYSWNSNAVSSARLFHYENFRNGQSAWNRLRLVQTDLQKKNKSISQEWKHISLICKKHLKAYLILLSQLFYMEITFFSHKKLHKIEKDS